MQEAFYITQPPKDTIPFNLRGGPSSSCQPFYYPTGALSEAQVIKAAFIFKSTFVLGH